MGGGKKSKRDGDKKSRKKGRSETPVSREVSDDEAIFDEISGDNSIIPSAAKVDVEKDNGAPEDEYGAKDFRSQMNLRPDHEVIFQPFCSEK